MTISDEKYSDDAAARILGIAAAAQAGGAERYFHHQEEYLNADNIRKHLGESGTVFFAYEEGRAVGTLSVCREEYGKRLRKLLAETEPSGYVIRFVAVLPEFQGRGIAKKLVQEALQYAAKSDAGSRVLVSTSYDNKPAIGLYKSCGFAPLNLFYNKDHFTIDLITGMKAGRVKYGMTVVKAHLRAAAIRMKA